MTNKAGVGEFSILAAIAKIVGSLLFLYLLTVICSYGYVAMFGFNLDTPGMYVYGSMALVATYLEVKFIFSQVDVIKATIARIDASNKKDEAVIIYSSRNEIDA